MELSSQDLEMPIPINSTFGGHLIHHNPPPPPPRNHDNIVTNSVPQLSSNGPMEDPGVSKKAVKYKECMKNHAASMGGNATDGCGEFMPGGEEGTVGAFTCSVCSCHRNFHRKEIDGGHHNHSPSCECYHYLNLSNRSSGIARKLILGHQLQYPTGAAAALVPFRTAQSHQMIMSSYNNIMASLPSESDEREDADNSNHRNGVGTTGLQAMAKPPHLLRKRFRTKFSQEQKEKMLNFAEKVGWKIQKQEEAVVQQFCQEVGVKRRVLKVWMHNNKHILAKKNCTNSISTDQNPID